MLEIVVEPRQSFSLKQAVIDAIKSGDYNSLYDDIRDCFTDEQVEEMEELLESGDLGDAIDEIVSEWNGEDLDELFETLESYFAESSIEIQFLLDEDFEDAEPDDEDFDEYSDIDEPADEPESDDEFIDPGHPALGAQFPTPGFPGTVFSPKITMETGKIASSGNFNGSGDRDARFSRFFTQVS